MKLLVTGASGFVGSAVVRKQVQSGSAVRAAVRRPSASRNEGAEEVVVGELSAETDWADALRDIDVIVHAAARVHMMHDTSADSLAEFRKVNVAGTLNLARQAVASTVRRLVFISSIKVNGEQTQFGEPFRADDLPRPTSPYAISKYEAEEGLYQVAKETGLEIVVIRPVLVYGAGAKGNFVALMRWIARGVPLPFGGIHNRRSLLALGNLVDLIAICARHPDAANQTFLASDREDLSTPELIRRTGEALGRRARLVPVPERLLWAAARLTGNADFAKRLFGSLQIDMRKTNVLLGWTPQVPIEDALKDAAQDFLRRRRG